MTNPIEPKHYKQIMYCDCIDVVERLPFCIGNAIKYIWRAGEKDNIKQDYQKAVWYLERAILNSEQLNQVEYSLLKVALELSQNDLLKSKIFEYLADYEWQKAIQLIKDNY